ncbi:MAG: GlsB/YeaQ/YmgE family stress response membrane protein [Deltaproteobacteria bacterium]|nr:GlsB/YeaQ/YmgE family stress response membrane protein [Deltaproteobacteria bacterium]
MDILTWILVGLVAGTLATFVFRGIGYGLVGNIVLGIVGAFVGGWGFRQLGWRAPLEGLGGVILVAFCGAVALLFVIGLISRSRRQ